MSNPLLNERFFGTTTSGGAVGSTAPGWGGGAPAPGAPIPPAWDNAQVSDWDPARAGKVMTIGGTVSATGVLLLLVLAGGAFGWTRVTETTGVDALGRTVTTIESFPAGWVFGPMIVGLVLALICSFKPPMARFLAPLYAVAQGIFVGAISHAYDVQTNGIVVQAILATAGVFAAMLVLYGLRVLRATPRFTKGVIAATFGVMAVYLVGWVASIFGADLRFWSDASPLGIAFSVVVVAIAAFNLILDFDFIERGSKAGLPAHMEWFGAFGLVVTIIWLYLELLRLLSKLQQR